MDWTAGYNRQRYWSRAQIMAAQRRLNQGNYMKLKNYIRRNGSIAGFRPNWLSRDLKIINPNNPWRRKRIAKSAYRNVKRRR